MPPGFSKVLTRRMSRLRVREADLQERFDRASGPGGQNVNKVATAVLLRHAPTGLSTRAASARSQAANRALARERLLDRLEKLQQGRVAASKVAARKARLGKRRRPRALKEAILESKRHRSTIKRYRSKPDHS